MKHKHNQTTTFTTTEGKAIPLSEKDRAAITAMLTIDARFKDVAQDLCLVVLKNQQEAAAKADA